MGDINVWQNFPDWLADVAVVAGSLLMLSAGVVTGRHLV